MLTLKPLLTTKTTREETLKTELMSHVLGRKHSIHDLYMNYKSLNEQHYNNYTQYEFYKEQIEHDLPRTFPSSRWFKKNMDKVRTLLRVYCTYSPIGYIQGQNFYAASLAYAFDGVPHIAFYAFITLFDHLKDYCINTIDCTKKYKENKDICMIFDIFETCYSQRHSNKIEPQARELIKMIIQWHWISTMCMKNTGQTLLNSLEILNYLLPQMYNRKKFRKKILAFMLSFLLCTLMDREDITLEWLGILQSSQLTLEGLLAIIETAKKCEYLIK